MPLQTVSADDWNTSLSDKTTVIGIGDDTYWVQNANKSWSISSTDGNIVRFEVRQDDVWYNDSLNKNRSELSSRTLIADGTEVDISYQFQLAPGAANTADWFVIGQLHQDDYVGAPAYSPPFGIYLDGEHMVIQVNYVDASGKQAFLKLYTDPNNIQRGHYYDMDITVTFYDNNTGHLVVVRDGVTVVDYTGPMGFTTQSSVYWKEGIYRSSDATETVVAYFKDLEITTSAVSIPTAPDPDPVNFTGTTGDDTLNGTSANDELRGLAGNDLLNGGAGADQMYGGPGNDTYVVDNSGDQVTEYSGEGTDTVNSTVSYTLSADVENLVLLGSA
ncbi:heparin lyase I family protein, partial [Xanthobacter autotrophicus]|uniref:heparin lyase I family protein n=1 Tax=Xanthobacter autotrophicus TaxID=280 RepID=UPI00372A3435